MGKPTSLEVSSGEQNSPTRLTQGTETSKYLQEKKSTEISKVAASEIDTV